MRNTSWVHAECPEEDGERSSTFGTDEPREEEWLFFAYGRFFLSPKGVHSNRPQVTTLNGLSLIVVFLAGAIWTASSVPRWNSSVAHLLLQTIGCSVVFVVAMLVRLLHAHCRTRMTPGVRFLVLFLYGTDVVVPVYLIVLHHVVLCPLSFSLSTQDIVFWLVTGPIPWLHIVPFRAGFLWPLPVRWTKTPPTDRRQKTLLVRARVLYYVGVWSVWIFLVGWLLLGSTRVGALLGLGEDPVLQSQHPQANPFQAPLYLLYRIGLAVYCLLDRRAVHVGEFLTRAHLKEQRVIVDTRRVQKVGFLKKFVHVARSAFSGLQFHCGELTMLLHPPSSSPVVLRQLSNFQVAHRTLIAALTESRRILDRLASTFELQSSVTDSRHAVEFSLKRTLQATVAQLGSGVVLRLQGFGARDIVAGDEEGLVEILTIVLGHALSAAEDGRVEVMATWRPTGQHGTLQLTISDSGAGKSGRDWMLAGVGHEDRKPMGESNWFVVTKTLVDYMNGHLHVASRGKGARAGMRVRVALPFLLSLENPRLVRENGIGWREKLAELDLVMAEDDPIIRNILRHCFRDARSLVILENGQELVDYMRSIPHDFDQLCVITDLKFVPPRFSN